MQYWIHPMTNSNTNKAEPCPTCYGTGYLPSYYNDLSGPQCPACHGTGFTPPADTPAAEQPLKIEIADITPELAAAAAGLGAAIAKWENEMAKVKKAKGITK
jgi:hypothetical protein